ncbi:hypothetical protein M430DRAFT_197341 [Amorphotheca resinae ATCC 22711]|jgi:hypothetical protein|uniref:Uncharacterized protein n=1 Tax=Amorphotheca resinae ATCC 22711 TaxID=857342 RepID=A0A2T3B9J7_AMORE|nr:hypothetical protein M430DRAFT_197341 [Amorphotheca resinae ATCC 22711]PSS25005.1 hypothetical protein M430DRAFT_197341 [Amorphotheca resinae ATCC 22711]
MAKEFRVGRFYKKAGVFREFKILPFLFLLPLFSFPSLLWRGEAAELVFCINSICFLGLGL